MISIGTLERRQQQPLAPLEMRVCSQEPERPTEASRGGGVSRERRRREAEAAAGEIAPEQLRKGRCSGKMQFHGTGKKKMVAKRGVHGRK